MELAITNDEEILMNLLCIVPVVPICGKIIYFKKRMEEEDALNYHIKHWITISSKYFRSFETTNKIIYSPSDLSL